MRCEGVMSSNYNEILEIAACVADRARERAIDLRDSALSAGPPDTRAALVAARQAQVADEIASEIRALKV